MLTAAAIRCTVARWPPAAAAGAGEGEADERDEPERVATDTASAAEPTDPRRPT